MACDHLTDSAHQMRFISQRDTGMSEARSRSQRLFPTLQEGEEAGQTNGIRTDLH